MVVQEVPIDHIISLEARTTCPNRETQRKRNGNDCCRPSGGDNDSIGPSTRPRIINIRGRLPSMLVHRCLLQVQPGPAGPRINCLPNGCNRCRLFCRAADAYARFALLVDSFAITVTPIENLRGVAFEKMVPVYIDTERAALRILPKNSFLSIVILYYRT